MLLKSQLLKIENFLDTNYVITNQKKGGEVSNFSAIM